MFQQNVGQNYIVSDILSDMRKIDAMLDAEVGIPNANTDKKERVQSAEVNANLGQASDYIYLLIDTFNKQADTYGLPFEMKFNGSMEEIYLNNENTAPANDVDVNDAKKGEEQNA